MRVADKTTISVDEIDPKIHFVVAEIDGNLCLGHQDYGVGDKFRFYPLNKHFTKGNHYMKIGSIKTVVRNLLKEGDVVEIFDDYRDALKWILDRS